MAEGVRAAALAGMLGCTPARVSQLVAEGRLEGSYSGAGRDRRFDPVKAAELLNVQLDRGQALGNGAAAARARREVLAVTAPDPRPAAGPGPLPADDGYQRARTESAQADARLKQLRLAQEEGRWVLAAEVDRASRRALAAELAQFEVVIRDGSRAAADRTGAPVREIKAAMLEAWRAHRARRRDDLMTRAESAEPAEAERQADPSGGGK